MHPYVAHSHYVQGVNLMLQINHPHSTATRKLGDGGTMQEFPFLLPKVRKEGRINSLDNGIRHHEERTRNHGKTTDEMPKKTRQNQIVQQELSRCPR